MAISLKQVNFDPRYIESLLLDESELQSSVYATGRELLRSYSRVPDDKIASHVADVQRRAYALCPYPCIGLLRFLICSLSNHLLYPTILSRIKEGNSYLDIGCCFGQDIRKLAYDGAPTNRCVAVDLEPRFFPLSEALFLDSGRLSARFVSADVFDTHDAIWAELQGTMDIVHASSFFHLFGLPKQRLIAAAICRLVRPVPGSVALGLQLAAAGEAEDIPILNEEEPTYCHSPATMQSLWDDAAIVSGLDRRGLKWKVDVTKEEKPKQMRVGLLSNPKLVDTFWVATLR